MLNKEIAEAFRNASPEVRKKALRLTIITLIENPDLSTTERLDRIEEAFRMAGWKELKDK